MEVGSSGASGAKGRGGMMVGMLNVGTRGQKTAEAGLVYIHVGDDEKKQLSASQLDGSESGV